MRYLLAALALAAGPAMSAIYTYEHSPGNGVRLSDAACQNAVILAMVTDEFKDQFRRGRATVNGKEHALCWIEAGDRVVMVYEDADKGVLPMKSFKKHEGA